MAFFSAVSSSIGKKLLLFGLRHIDILDKDPADFVSVDVGKKTTLEVRDVGLHVKKLVALLHLKLPPEIHLSKARASLFRVTFILEFGVPQIIIEIDGIQVHAHLAEDTAEPPSKSRGKERSPPRARSPPLHSSSPPPPHADDLSDASSDDEDHIPTVDDLAESFIREEPEDEIKELEQELESQSAYLHESTFSSDEGDDESTAGMGAPLALPTYLRNILNTALDRLKIDIQNIDIEVQDQFPHESPSLSKEEDDPYVSLNFHVDRVAVDSVTSEDPRVAVLTSPKPTDDQSSKLGKRRMRVENICARLISDADNFASMSRVSRPSSPADTRSEISSSHKSQSEPSASLSSADPDPLTHPEQLPASPRASFRTGTVAAAEPQPGAHALLSRQDHLSSSVHTTDDDRFADAASDDDMVSSEISESGDSLHHDLTASSFLYDDMENELINSQVNDPHHDDIEASRYEDHNWGLDGAKPAREEARKLVESASSSTGLPTASTLGQLSASIDNGQEKSLSSLSDKLPQSTDNLDNARHHIEEQHDLDQSIHSPPPSHVHQDDDLSQSQLFSHDDAESMYLSAMSAAPMDTSRRPNVPGGWESSSSTSSHDTASDTSAPVPEDMVTGSILEPPLEADDGCETPRPGSPQSVFSSPRLTHQAPRVENQASSSEQPKPSSRLAKVFFTIDSITVWFPLGLSDEQPSESANETEVEVSRLDFQPPNLVEDSIFQGMPGSFSNYAHSTSSRRKTSVEEAARRRPDIKMPQTEKPTSLPKSKSSATVSIEIGTVLGHIDFSTGRIMFQIINRALAALTDASDDDAPTDKEQSKPQEPSVQPKKRSSVEISTKYVGIAWRERLLAESIEDGGAVRAMLEPNPLDAILKISLSSLHAVSQTVDVETRAKFTIGKFVLASLDHDIITFQSSRPKSRRSVGSAPEQLHNDIEIDYAQTKDRRLTIVTRPVKVLFDLQKIDEALGSFGGFSGVLELSSSITSNNLVVNSPAVSVAPSRPRGVHFKDTPPAPPSTSPSNAPKIDMQLGEVTLTLKGKSCAVQLQTTTVRLAVRQSNVRLKVSEAQLSGPYLDGTYVEAPLMVEIRNSTVNFLFLPEEVDLSRLISMITPSKDPYENNDDILMHTLLQQRRKGSVLRAEVASVVVQLSDLEQLKTFEALGAEVSKLSRVTKYLPDDDRPGILTLATVQKVDVSAMVNERLGLMSVLLSEASIAHVGVPALFATEIGKVSVQRGDEVLVHEVVRLRPQEQLPMVMMRFVGDEMEPVVKAKIFNLCAEYRVSTVMVALGISEDGTTDDIALGIASSVATITRASSPKTLSRQSSASSSPSTTTAKPLHLDVLLRNCALGLNPRKIPAKGLFVLTDAHFLGKQSAKSSYTVEFELRKASIQAIDDVSRLEKEQEPPSSRAGALPSNRQLSELTDLGYVSLSSISAAKILVNITGDGKDEPQRVDVEFKNELLILESCADSTQTLIAVLNGLQPPMPPSTAERYRTVVPLQEMLESFTGDAVVAPEGSGEDEFMEHADLVSDEVPTNLQFVGSFYNAESLPTEEELGDSLLGEDDLGALATPPITRQRGDRGLLESFQEHYEVAEGEQDFDFNEDYFKGSESEHEGMARKWNSTKNEYHLTNEFHDPNAPLRVRVRDVNIIWNLYDGYDWPKTRSIIAQAVDDIEARAEERRQRSRDEDEDDDFVEEDFLFNSVWIGVPIRDEKGELAQRINRDINRDMDDQTSETGSYATSTATRSTGATIRPRSATKSSKRRLKLERSKRKKIAFQLMGVAVDLVVFPPDSGVTVNSVDVRVRDFEIYDHFPTSNWKKFVTSLIEPDQREMNRPMIGLELLTVKPIPELAASELIIKVKVLPLLLHVDQDALEFIQRFFEFKDDSALESSSPAEQMFIARLEVNTVKLELHYKPRRVDYRGLRAGQTTELMNFLILEGSAITLQHAIVYGVVSFDQVHKTLNNIWMPDIQRNQLAGVLSGLAAVRPLINVGSGVRDLVMVPMREYKKDGRVVRSLQKGVYAFATHTTSEAARLGAKVAIGVQNVLEGAEKLLSPAQTSSSTHHHDWDGEDPSSSDSEESRMVSNYANQPIGVRAGLRSAARHLERDLLTARDAIIAIPSEVMEEGTGVGMARAIAKRAPTIVLRPAAGVMKATSNALQGVGNALDPQSRRKIDDKYKSY